VKRCARLSVILDAMLKNFPKFSVILMSSPNLKFILIALLMCAVFISALQLVLVRHKNRMFFIELQAIQQQYDTLKVSYGQLQLEHSSLTQYNRIETIARQQLDMIRPTPDDIVISRRPPPAPSLFKEGVGGW
jgi:cell division protein FtsL